MEKDSEDHKTILRQFLRKTFKKQKKKMDNDAKYLKRKVKAGTLDVHPTEKALNVNYELVTKNH